MRKLFALSIVGAFLFLFYRKGGTVSGDTSTTESSNIEIGKIGADVTIVEGDTVAKGAADYPPAGRQGLYDGERFVRVEMIRTGLYRNYLYEFDQLKDDWVLISSYYGSSRGGFLP